VGRADVRSPAHVFSCRLHSCRLDLILPAVSTLIFRQPPTALGTLSPVSDTHEALNVVPPLTDHDVFSSDVALVEAVQQYGGEQHLGRLRELGRLAGSSRSARWAEYVDRNPPQLHSHDPYGRRIDEIDYHPAWHRLMQTGVRAGLAATPWEPGAAEAAHLARAASLLVWAQAEPNHTAALTTTYAAVPALRTEDRVADVWMPRLASRAYESGLRPGQDKLGCLAGIAVAERQAGSDLRATLTVAQPEPSGPFEAGNTFRLTGQKWFVSSPMSDVFLVLAQAPGGPTCFLVPRVLADGTLNTWRLQRLKNKLGNRPVASAEVELEQTWGVRVGEEGRGLRVLLGTVSATRLDSVLTGTALMRTSLTQAVHHARYRQAFGSPLVDKPLMQNVLADLAVETEAATLLALRLAAAVDAGETELLRVAVPVAKYWICKRTPQVVAEALECLGGNGVVEEHGLARHYRDALPGALWESTGNVTALDVLRAMSLQPRSMEVLLGEVDRARGADPRLDQAMDEVAGYLQAAAREARREPAAVEAGARWLVERLAVVLQASLLVRSAPAPVASTFLTTRVAGGGGVMFGTLPVGRQTTKTLVDRVLTG
jgi:putative acyl-CoA dehydrogenase